MSFSEPVLAVLDLFPGLLVLRYQGTEVGEDVRVSYRLPFGRKQFRVSLDVQQLLTDQDEFLGKDGVVLAPQCGELPTDRAVGDLAR